MFRLDYLSCALTILSTILVSRRLWQGWVVAAANSVIICIIGVHTAQLGFVPANLFCLALYAHAIYKWKSLPRHTASQAETASHSRRRHGSLSHSRWRRKAKVAVARAARAAQMPRLIRVNGTTPFAPVADERADGNRDRVPACELPAQSRRTVC